MRIHSEWQCADGTATGFVIGWRYARHMVQRHRHYYGEDPSQWGELFLPEVPGGGALRGVVVVIHGGYWRSKYGAELGEPGLDAIAEFAGAVKLAGDDGGQGCAERGSGGEVAVVELACGGGSGVPGDEGG